MFPKNLKVSSSPLDLNDAEIVILAVPSATLRSNLQLIKTCLPTECILVSAVKGLEIDSGKRMSQLIQEECPSELHTNITVLSGPNLAMEIIEGKPSSTVVASSNIKAASKVQHALTGNMFRVYTNNDIIGVELGGALKNIIAIGAGICDGLGYGDNTKAAFITRGLAEISRLGIAAGAQPLTLSGLAGIGDLIATCSSKLSRNRHVGHELAKGKTMNEIRASMENVAEGINTTQAAMHLSDFLKVEMPITSFTYKILFEKMSVKQAISELMDRAVSPE
jgi:glycerol-3-phosphate dehydrogenase (NAD(P)+)